MRKYIDSALKILTKVFSDGAYSNMAFYGESMSDMTTKLVYGVLEQNIQIEYILASLVDKKPQNSIFYLLKIGVYALNNLTDVPDYAIVSECVEVAKSNGKGGASGFVNAVLKKVSRKEYKVPSAEDKNYLSFVSSKPQWFIDKLTSQYGADKARECIFQPTYTLEHIRINKRLTQLSSVKDRLEKSGLHPRESEVGGLIVQATDEVKRLFDEGLVTFQSPSSMLAVKGLAPKDGARVLDMCSAPGGKAVYMSELCPHSVIIACDIHPHRVQLIQKYKQRMHAPNIRTELCDATVFREEWANTFDYVLLDAPCSCFGTFNKHPDVFLSRDERDIKKLSELQRKIADNAARYLKSGGVMLYSTCTLFYEENGAIIDFLTTKGFVKESMRDIPFDNDGTLQIMPHDEWDGFYVARLRKQ